MVDGDIRRAGCPRVVLFICERTSFSKNLNKDEEVGFNTWIGGRVELQSGRLLEVFLILLETGFLVWVSGNPRCTRDEGQLI